jgi:anti-sigma factor ChrR (cupin superfamily)
MKDESNDTSLLADWARHLQDNLKQPSRPAELRSGVLARVATSAQAHVQYLTLRRERSVWLPGGPGIEVCKLRSDDGFAVELLRLASGVAVPHLPEAAGQELLLLEGELIDPSDGRLWPPLSYAFMDAEPGPAGPWAKGSALLYRRAMRGGALGVPVLEREWWSQPIQPEASRWAAPGTWTASSPGVEVMLLRSHRHVVSMLVRFAAGASVPDHSHALDEDCLVLEGEMFLGDILLRSGDYQLAPAGGGHFGETSDVGVLFFFHGALDANLRGKRRP